MGPGYADADTQNYKEWVSIIQKQIDMPGCLWNRVGIWGFPSKDNGSFSDVVIHYCFRYYTLYKSGGSTYVDKQFHKCCACGEETPDGIKMIALLEKL